MQEEIHQPLTVLCSQTESVHCGRTDFWYSQQLIYHCQCSQCWNDKY